MIDGEMTNGSAGLRGGLSLTGLSYLAFPGSPVVSYLVMDVPNWSPVLSYLVRDVPNWSQMVAGIAGYGRFTHEAGQPGDEMLIIVCIPENGRALNASPRTMIRWRPPGSSMH